MSDTHDLTADAKQRRLRARRAVAALIRAAKDAAFAGAQSPDEARAARLALDKARSQVMEFMK